MALTPEAQLLQDVESLTPQQRRSRAIGVARRLQADDVRQLADLLAALGAGSTYDRRLAALMASAVGYGPHLAVAAWDDDPSVALIAVAAKDLPAGVAREVAIHGSVQARRVLYRQLCRGERRGLAADLLPIVRRLWGEAEAAALLPSCDASTVAEHLPGLAHVVTKWRVLVRRFPQVMAAFATEELADAGGGHPARQWWITRSSLALALAEFAPVVVLDLIETEPDGELPGPALHHLVRLLDVDAERTVRALRANPLRAKQLIWVRLSRAAAQRLAALDGAKVGRLLRATGPDDMTVIKVLRALPPSRRETVFDHAFDGTERAQGLLSLELAGLLPHRRRELQARIMLANPVIADSPLWSAQVAALLPLTQAMPLIDELIASADAQERAEGYALSLHCAIRQGEPEPLVAALERLVKARNERDPVRQAIVQACRHIPFTQLTAETVPLLEQLIHQAMNARDASAGTSSAVSVLLVRALWQSASAVGSSAALGDWSLSDWASGAIEQYGFWNSGRALWPDDLVAGLRRGQEQPLWNRLEPSLSAAVERDQPTALLRLATALGRRGWQLPGLQQALGRAVHAPSDATMRTAVQLWLAPPATRDERVRSLLATDPSMITFGEVLNNIATRQTDLFERHVLSGEPVIGRFVRKGIFKLPILPVLVQLNWTPAQQIRYATLLARTASDTQLDRATRAVAIRALAGAPGARVDALTGYLEGDDELLAEAALTGVAERTGEADQVLALLLRHSDGDRARVAVYGIARVLRRLPSRAAAPLLEPLLRAKKVVMRKEAARLVTMLRPPAAVDLLLVAHNREGQHRDVRIAIVIALTAFLDDERVLPALSEAVTDPDRHLAGALLGVRPEAVALAHRAAIGQLIGAATRHPQAQVVNAAFGALARWFRWAPGAADDVVRELVSLDRLTTWNAALVCLTQPQVWSVAPRLPARVAAELLELIEVGPQAGAERDLPARRRLESLVLTFEAHADDIRVDSAATLAVAAVLGAAEDCRLLAARLQWALAQPGKADFAARVTAFSDLLVTLPAGAAGLLQLTSRQPAAGDWSGADVLASARELTDRGDTTSGLVARHLVAAGGGASTWSEPWRRHAQELRRHAQGDVRLAALSIDTGSLDG